MASPLASSVHSLMSSACPRSLIPRFGHIRREATQQTREKTDSAWCLPFCTSSTRSAGRISAVHIRGQQARSHPAQCPSTPLIDQDRPCAHLCQEHGVRRAIRDLSQRFGLVGERAWVNSHCPTMLGRNVGCVVALGKTATIGVCIRYVKLSLGTIRRAHQNIRLRFLGLKAICEVLIESRFCKINAIVQRLLFEKG